MSSVTSDIPQRKYMLMKFAELEAYDVRNKKTPTFLFKSYFNHTSLKSDKPK